MSDYENGTWMRAPETCEQAEVRSVQRELGDEIRRLTAENARLREMLRGLEPYLDSIVCYASTIDEHEPNRIVRDIRAALETPNDR